MKYLKSFKNEAELKRALQNGEVGYPWVCDIPTSVEYVPLASAVTFNMELEYESTVAGKSTGTTIISKQVTTEQYDNTAVSDYANYIDYKHINITYPENTDTATTKTISGDIVWNASATINEDKERVTSTLTENYNITQDVTKDECTVKFFNEDGVTEITSYTVEIGSTIVAPVMPAREGYTFSWTPAFNPIANFDVNYVATYTVVPGPEPTVTYTIKFVDYDDTEIDEKVYNEGETVVIPSNPTREGYNFNGWQPEVNPTAVADATYKATYTEKPGPGPEPEIEYVDLGLPSGLLWAKCNVGADTEEGYGLMFQWGDTVGHDYDIDVKDYSRWNTCPFNNGATNCDEEYFASISATVLDVKYTSTSVDVTLKPEYDAARVHMGDDWRMPTTKEFRELYQNTIQTIETINGVNGIKFTNKTDANLYIFIPLAGMGNYGQPMNRGNSCYVWSSSLATEVEEGWEALSLYYMSDEQIYPNMGMERRYSFSVRGVNPINVPPTPPTPPTNEMIRFTAVQSSTIQLASNGNPNPITMYKSNDGFDWEVWDRDTISLNQGEYVYIKGDNPNGLSKSDDDYYQFKLTGNITCGGNLMGLLGKDITEIPCDFCFNGLFSNCHALLAGPKLLATTLTLGCYNTMYMGCSSLQYVPGLPATTLAQACYKYMFMGCSSLIMAPELPATTLVQDCYRSMFTDCPNLNYIKALFTTTPSDDYTYGWTYGVASNGTFVKSTAATWDVRGMNGIPDGWTIETA